MIIRSAPLWEEMRIYKAIYTPVKIIFAFYIKESRFGCLRTGRNHISAINIPLRTEVEQKSFNNF
jgi:hypothetical protein